MTAQFGRSVRQPWPGYELGLTLRESEVALFLAQGLRNRDIASALWVSENTVKTHLKSIFQKTAVTSRAEAIVRISQRPELQPETTRASDRGRRHPPSAANGLPEALTDRGDGRGDRCGTVTRGLPIGRPGAESEMLVFGARSEQAGGPMNATQSCPHTNAR